MNGADNAHVINVPCIPNSLQFIAYIATLSKQARILTPAAVLFMSPYGTRSAVNDSTFVGQLRTLDIDVIAYQDEVGCVRDEVGGVIRICVCELLAGDYTAPVATAPLLMAVPCVDHLPPRPAPHWQFPVLTVASAWRTLADAHAAAGGRPLLWAK